MPGAEQEVRERIIRRAADDFYQALLRARDPADEPELQTFVDQLEDRINRSPKSNADKDLLREGLQAAHEQMKRLIQLREQYATYLQTQAVDNPDKLERAIHQLRGRHQSLGDKDLRNEALDRAAKRLRERLIDDQGQQERVGVIGIWPKYKEYRNLRSTYAEGSPEEQAFFDQLAIDLSHPNTAWNQPDVRLILEKTFQLTYNIISETEKLNPDEAEIRQWLEELSHESEIRQTGNSETRVLYERAMAAAERKGLAPEPTISSQIISDIKKELSPEEQLLFDNLIRDIEELGLLLQELRTQGINLHNIDTLVKEELRSELSDLNKDEYKTFLSKLKRTRRIPQDTRENFENELTLLIQEAEILLGNYTGEIPDDYGEEMKMWVLYGPEYAAIRETEALWRQYKAGNRTLVERDRRRLEELLDRFRQAAGRLDPTDVSYNRRFVVFDIQINRLQQMLGDIQDLTSTRRPEQAKPTINTRSEWAGYYRSIEDPMFWTDRAYELMDALEGADGETWDGKYEGTPEYEGLRDALGAQPGGSELWHLGVLMEKNQILFNAQYKPAHSFSITCDADQLPPLQYRGVDEHLFDYFTLTEAEITKIRDDNPGRAAHEVEFGYKYSHLVMTLVLWMKEVIQEKDSEFEFGRKWIEDLPNRERFKLQMENHLKIIAPGLKDNGRDCKQIVHLAYRMATITNAAIDWFTPKYAAGATPPGEIGVRAGQGYFKDHNIFAQELYSLYKRRIYSQLAEIFKVDEEWRKRIIARNNGQEDGRMVTIRESLEASEAIVKQFSPLRDPRLVLPVLPDGYNIRNTYYSMHELFFDPRVRAARREKQVTLKQWAAGKKSFVNFKEFCFDTPGGFSDVEKELAGLSAEDVAKELMTSLDILIKDHLSQMKTNQPMQNWRDIAFLSVWYIDRIFRVYAAKDPQGGERFLKRVRARMKQAIPTNLERVGKVDPPKQGEEMSRDALLSKDGRILDLGEYLLEQFPDPVLLEVADAVRGLRKGRPAEVAKSIKPLNFFGKLDAYDRVSPKITFSFLNHPFEVISYRFRVSDLLTGEAYEFFKKSAKEGVFGRRPEKQQADPDKK